MNYSTYNGRPTFAKKLFLVVLEFYYNRKTSGENLRQHERNSSIHQVIHVFHVSNYQTNDNLQSNINNLKSRFDANKPYSRSVQTKNSRMRAPDRQILITMSILTFANTLVDLFRSPVLQKSSEQHSVHSVRLSLERQSSSLVSSVHGSPQSRR